MSDEKFGAFLEWAGKNGVLTPAPSSAPTASEPPTPLPDTPAAWFAAKFPNLPARYGPAAEEVRSANGKGRPFVKDLSEDFLTATLGEEGSPKVPTVFAAEEDRFYT